MKKILSFLFLTLPILSYADVFDQNPATSNERGFLFEIHGSNTIGAELAPTLLTQWLQNHEFTDIQRSTLAENEQILSATKPGFGSVSIFIAAHGSGTGFAQIKQGTADIAAASRPAKDSENDLFPNTDISDFEHETVVAIDGISVIVHPGNGIGSLTIDQIGQIFAGKINNWSELGGKNLRITVHARDDKSGTFDTFNTLVLKRGYQLSGEASRYESNQELANTVATLPGAIGFTSVATLGAAKALRIADGEGIAMAPTHTAIATEDYPLARRLYLYQVNTSNPFARDFLAFVKSVAGQSSVGDVGFISLNLEELPMTVQGELPAGYALITEKSKRITTNFRFIPGTKKLDNKALDDLGRLADYMKRPENQNRKLILIGFSNQQKDEFKARLLSESRVISVKRELDKLGVVSSALTGYGQINPIASNADIKYALRNQRVEVWIR